MLFDKLLTAAKLNANKLDWRDYINIRLYDVDFGYYRKDKKRVGYENADFYTSSSLKNGVFGELIEASFKNLLSQSNLPKDLNYTLCEIGAEPDSSTFKNAKVLRLGDSLEIPDNSFVFSNELLDAQPFSRFIFQGNKWQKGFLEPTFDTPKTTGLISQIEDKNPSKALPSYIEFQEFFSPPTDLELHILNKYFSRAKVEGFRIDFSFDANNLLTKILSTPKNSIFIFADYFRTAEELCRLPAGTARTYHKHTQSSNLLLPSNIEADYTFSPCSDILIDIAKSLNFTNAGIMTQESFLIHNATSEIEDIVKITDPFSQKKRDLAHLISPSLLGSCFRIFYCF